VTPTLVDLGGGVTFEPDPVVFAGVRPACPRCPWRGWPVVASTQGWRQRIADDLGQHTCTNPDQEKP
jgi:hypothetical protein